MYKWAYYFKRIFTASYKEMYTAIGRVSQRSNRNKIIIFLDMVVASLRYGAGYTDYFLFHFENLNHSQRKTYITRMVNNTYIKAMNDSRFYDVFWNKEKFNNHFNEFLKRDFLVLEEGKEEEFEEFVKKHPIFMAKMISSTGGVGVEKVEVNKKTILTSLFKELIQKNQKLLEEYVVQHPVMNELCAKSVNTLRIVTGRKNGQTRVLMKVIRVGNGDFEVDNFHKGGMFTVFDEKGIITKPAVDREGIIYEKHPKTETKFAGFEIPYYKEAVSMCEKASEKVPEVGLLGWDIAITPNGPVMIEGNELPGYDLYQSKVHLDENMHGLKPLFDNAIFERVEGNEI